MTVTTDPTVDNHSFLFPVAVFLLLAALYASTANWTVPEQNVDTIAATLPGWHLVTGGGLDVSEYQGLNPWFVETPDGVWTNRPPGLVTVAAIAHAVFLPFDDGYHGYPGTVASVVLTAAAVALVAELIRRRTGRQAAWLTAAALGIGSAAWPQASRELVPHGVDMLLLAGVLAAMERGRWTWVGIASGAALLVRPPIAVAALVIGVGAAVHQRKWKPMFQVGVPSTVGLALLIGYNRLVFGSFSISGGYAQFIEGGSEYRTPAGYARNLLGTFLDPSNGLFLWSSWIAVLIVVLVFRRPRPAFDGAALAALAGLAYLLVHTGLNRYWGGVAFSYRYAIEPLVLTMPFLAQGIPPALERRPLRMALGVAVGVSILLQGAVAMLLTCTDLGGGVGTCSFT